MIRKQWRAIACFLAIFALGSVLLAACSRPGTASTSSSTASSNTPAAASCPAGDTVKTGLTSFEQTCITLTKGSSLKIAQDQTTVHIFDYGQWDGNTAKTETPPDGAPKLNNLQLSGDNVSVGPFTTAGTYHIYCTIHPGMMLTVTVK